MTTLQTFKKFYADDAACDMFITGPAGSGKTTDSRVLIEYCIEHGIKYVITAFTHKACSILKSKLPGDAKVTTLHAFLKKRPGINPHATDRKQVKVSTVMGEADQVEVLFVDEYSMVGERDLMDIRALQAEDENGREQLRIVWIGDPNQLPPVGDMQTLEPFGDYCVWLNQVKRLADSNPLMKPLAQLVSFINGTTPEPLVTSDKFQRGLDIIELFKHDSSADKVLLAYTNERVEQLNALIAGRDAPEYGDALFCPQDRVKYTMLDTNTSVPFIVRPFAGILEYNTKYRTLEHLRNMPGISYGFLSSEEGDDVILAYVFGHYQYKRMHDDLMQKAVASNAAIETKFKEKAAAWASRNHDSALAKQRAKAWRDFLTFNECVVCLDFPHAMTVHKSQGSTYAHVYMDTEDIGRCAARNYNLYLKLLYVGISRSSDFVITN